MPSPPSPRPLDGVVRVDAQRRRRAEAAVVPVDRHRAHVSAGAEPVGRQHSARTDLLVHTPGARGFHGQRGVQLERVERRVEVVGSHVRHPAAAEGPPPAPVERRIGRVIGTPFGRPQPQVPVEARGHVRGALGSPLPRRKAARGAPRRALRGPDRWRRPRSTRRSGDALRSSARSCPSASRLPSPWRLWRRSGLPRCRGSAASRSRHACRPSSRRSRRRHGDGPGWR